ncbi:MAG: hypothetical protein H0V66_09080 [Bdellovibrionales bacterium]|nr:hypothetical protein [Bdellovibrionales bacterium]
MAALKIKPTDLASLFPDGKDQTLQQKKDIEALRQRLNEKLQDPKVAKKAALILASWINQKPK